MRKAPSPAPRTPPPVSTSQPHVRTNSSNSAAQPRHNVSSSASPPSNQPLPVLVVTQQQSASPSQQAHPQQSQSHNTNSKKSSNNMSFDTFLQRRNEEIQRANARLQRQDQEMDQWVDAQQRLELQHLHNMMSNKKQQAFFPTTTERVTVTSPPSHQQQSGSSAQSPQKLSHFYRGSEFASLQSTTATTTPSLQRPQPTTSPYALLDERSNSITPSQNTTHEHHKQLYEELKQRHREQQQQQQRLQQQQQQIPRNNVASSSPRPQQPTPTYTTTTTRATATGAISASTSFRAPPRQPSVSGESSSSPSSQQSTHRPSLTHSNNETPPNPQQRSTTIPATHHHAPPPSSHRAPPPSSTPPLFLFNLCDQILTPLGCLPAPLLFHLPPLLSGMSCEAAGRQRSDSSNNSAPSSSSTGAATEQLVHLLHAWLAQSPVLLQSTTTTVSSSSRDQKSSSHTHPPTLSQRRSWRRMRRAQKARLIALLWHVVNRVVFYSIRALTPPTGEGDETAPSPCPTTLTETTPSSTQSSSAPAQEKKSHQSKTSSSSTSSAAAVERLLRAAGVPSSHSHSTHSSSSTAAAAGERGSTTNTNATTTTPSSSSSMLLLPLAQWALTLRCLAEQQYPRIRSLSVGGPPTEQCGIHLTMMMMTSPNDESETNIPFDDDMYEEENVERETTTTTTAEDEEEDSCMDQTVLELSLALCWLIQKHRLPAVAGLVQLRARAPFLFERVTAPSDREDGSKERDHQTYDDVAPPVPPSPPPACFSYPACDTWGHLLDLPTITGTAAAATFTKNTTTTAVEEAERRQGHALTQLWAHRAAETEDLFRHIYNGLHRNNNNKSPPPQGCREGTRGVLEALHSVHTALEQSHRLLVERDALLWSGGLLPSAAGSSTVGAVIPCPLDAVLSLPAHAALYEEVRRGMRHVVEEMPAAVECVQQSLRDFGDCLVTMATVLGVPVLGASAARGVGIMQRGTTSINRSSSDHEARLRRQRQELAWSHALAEDRESLSRHHSEPHNDGDDDDGDDPPSLAPQQKGEDCPPHSGVEGRSMRMMTSRAKLLLRSFESSDSYRLLTSVFDQQQQQQPQQQAVVDDDPQAVTVRLMRERYSLQSCLAAEWWSRHCRRANRPPRCDDAAPQPPQRHSDTNRSVSNERNQNEEKHKNNSILRRERSSSAHSEAHQAMRLASMLRTQFRTVLTPTTSTHPSTNNNHNNGTKNKDVSKAQKKSASGSHGKVGGRRGECPAAPVCFSPRLIGFRLWQGGKSTAAASSSSSAVAETQRLLELCRELQAAFDLEKKVPHHAANAVAELRRTPSTAESTSSATGLRMVTRFGWRGGTHNENRAAQE